MSRYAYPRSLAILQQQLRYLEVPHMIRDCRVEFPLSPCPHERFFDLLFRDLVIVELGREEVFHHVAQPARYREHRLDF